MKNKINCLLITFFLWSVGYSQNYFNDYIKSNSMQSQNTDTSLGVVENNNNLNSKSPLGAVLRSAILPGWGQFYNESYWKIPIVYGVLGWFIYNWVDNNNKYTDFRSRYSQSININQENSNLKLLRDFYRDQRDLFAIYIGLTYFLNILDAFVDAHLYGFDLNVDLSKFLVKINYNF